MGSADTVIEQAGPVLYRVKVNDQTWKHHVEQLRNSNLSPFTEETTSDCSLLRCWNIVYPWSYGIDQAETPPTAGMSHEVVHSPEPNSLELIPEQGLITTHSGQAVNLPQRLKD